jgi:hypothetical protein
MILLATAGSTITKWLRRAILALGPPGAHSNRNVPPEFYRFPPF